MADMYASAKKVDRLEHELTNLRLAFEAQTALMVEMRNHLMPIPIDDLYARQQSPAVRHVGAVG